MKLARLSWLAVFIGVLACEGDATPGEAPPKETRDARVADAASPSAEEAAVDAASSDASPLDASDTGSIASDGGSDARSDVATDAQVDAHAEIATGSERQACIAWVEEICRRAERCAPYSEYAHCRSRANYCPDLLFSPGATNDVASVLACAPAWNELSCYRYQGGGAPACTRKGTRAVGESCIYASQCTTNACSGDGFSACGVCIERLPEGGTCSPQNPCADGLGCFNNRCTAIADGGPETRFPGDECALAANDCISGRCEADTSSSLGGRCLTTPLGSYCEVESCSEDAYCDTISGTCKPLPLEGTRCASRRSDWYRDCAPGSYCSALTCVKTVGLGESCYQNSTMCSPGQRCTGATYSETRCTRDRQEGESCTDALDTCTTGTACTNGTCKSAIKGWFTNGCK